MSSSQLEGVWRKLINHYKVLRLEYKRRTRVTNNLKLSLNVKEHTLSVQNLPKHLTDQSPWSSAIYVGLTNVTESVVDDRGHCTAQLILGFDPHRDELDRTGHTETD